MESRKQHAHSVFYNPKESANEDDTFIIKTKPDSSQAKQERTTKSGYKK